MQSTRQELAVLSTLFPLRVRCRKRTFVSLSYFMVNESEPERRVRVKGPVEEIVAQRFAMGKRVSPLDGGPESAGRK